jgi:pilus assembly protein Flp/PilA
MRKFKNALVNFLKREVGPSAVVFAVLIGLIFVVCIAAISALGSNEIARGTWGGRMVGTA